MQTFRELYVEYGMCWEFEKQRSAAMRAYKATGDEKELLRAAALMLAPRDANRVRGHSTGMGNSDADAGSMGPEPLLKLANGMLAKLYQKGGIESYDSFMMYAKTLLLLRRGRRGIRLSPPPPSRRSACRCRSSWRDFERHVPWPVVNRRRSRASREGFTSRPGRLGLDERRAQLVLRRFT